jgi:hypothetical protein
MGGIVKGIGSALEGIGKAVGEVVQGVGKFLESPLGGLALQVGLAFFTGGASLLAGGGLEGLLGGALGEGGIGSALGGLLGGGGGGGLGSLFSGLAGNLFGDSASMLSGTGLQTLEELGQGASSSGGLLELVEGLAKAQATQPQQADGSQQGALVNVQQIIAMLHAQQLAS